ncbi:MAG: 3-hydroxyacyl-[acyl-carrier-protein] dehydratase, FabZ form [Candidatus Carbobacillus altaicus]|uniref:3-hydroxyacyl-[acyl-carrier-protein] dehydratase FabZ n=1 Tax=Candidatus Carbonibacillus altaicus TaxID=2163959 RepID=A0A2R6XYZ7_9BACL|nr:MAG: 3-hydroxyacyl-[acyl-carrier-protein] dehydratase, FabZ form [Candidatus Carbobacillus altaicus]
MAETKIYSIDEIMQVIPHRPPFLLIDKITAVEPGITATGLKQVTMNEPHFVGHFPNYPVMPGVLIIEALAQVGAFALLMKDEHRGKLAFFTGIDDVRFRRQVRPGDTLVLKVTIERMRAALGRGKAMATVAGEVAAEGVLSFALMEQKEDYESKQRG